MKVSYVMKIGPKYTWRVLRGKLRRLPRYKASKPPRVAFCLCGLVGGITGKAGDNLASSVDVLKIGYDQYKKHIFDKNNVDVFVHSWSTDLKADIKKLYKPKKSLFETNRPFKYPSYAKGEPRRISNHYSRWYSTQKAIELKAKYEKEQGFKYDFVMVIRFDLAPQKDILFDRINPKYFYAANWYSNAPLFGVIPINVLQGYPYTGMSGLADLWFFSNSRYMDRFAKLYDKLDEYNKPGSCPLGKQGISNHILSGYHLQQSGIIKDLRFIYNQYGPNETMPLIRKKYFGSKI
ncbi:hypothetical protein HOD83_02505 [Candidatus Woesearchaeota archaeon]|jgi:hypothetical protein|nr:hypothetical protein [Candidatus Woesearchaeota archaeon]MBT4114119.1 hypothetical protein [Candidatus Woesearchaeota archaeon]MBT4248438.1 hypothetical protein [Candidatus Woesearchaeota archaeon]